MREYKFQVRLRNRLNRFLAGVSGDVYYASSGALYAEKVLCRVYNGTITIFVNRDRLTKKGWNRVEDALQMLKGKRFTRNISRAFAGAQSRYNGVEIEYQ